VLVRPGFDRAAPTLPGTSRIRLPSASPPCYDRTEAKVSHLHSSSQRLTAHVDRGWGGAAGPRSFLWWLGDRCGLLRRARGARRGGRCRRGGGRDPRGVLLGSTGGATRARL